MMRVVIVFFIIPLFDIETIDDGICKIYMVL